jgi:hypothetical protein
MADKIGADDMAHDQLGLGARRARRLKQGLADFEQPLRLYLGHGVLRKPGQGWARR